ncbi:MAG: hypothetical protein ACO1OF_18260 [Adhaeribacter sp.]
MLLDNLLIKNRPKELLKAEFYTELPKVPVKFDYSKLPSFLNIDLLQLFGIMPKTIDLIENTQKDFFINPSAKEVEYYKKKGTRFQIINVVANIHTFKLQGDTALAYPYSISLIAGPKRGLPDTCSIEFLDKIGLDKINFSKNCYTDFSPFSKVEVGFHAPIGLFYGGDRKIKSYTDTIGFILETFFLPTDIELEKALISGPHDFDQTIIDKYDKYRIKRYFKPFNDILPRRIWGCDSPIELFLIQALAQRDLFPTIQSLIFKNGEVHDNYYEMISSETFIKGDELITEVDLYFPKEKIAVFCDSTKHHRNEKAKLKDAKISYELEKLGIKSLRINGKDIVYNLSQVVQNITSQIKSDT